MDYGKLSHLKMKFKEGDIVEFRVENGILLGAYTVEIVNLDVALKATEIRHEFTKGEVYPTIVDFSNVKHITKEAREYFTQDRASENLTAIAAVINSPVGKIMVNFFLNINKPPYPVKIFTDYDKAYEWIKQYA